MQFTAKKRKKHRSHANKPRKGFSIKSRGNTLPLLLSAALAAILTHVAALQAGPWLLQLWQEGNKNSALPAADDDYTRIHIVMQDSRDPTPPDPEQPLENSKVEEELQQIDPADLLPEELTIAPGETNIPAPLPPDSQEAVTMNNALGEPLDIDLANVNMGDKTDSDPTDFAPLNNSNVLIPASPQSDMDEKLENSIKKKLEKSARIGRNTPLPDNNPFAHMLAAPNPGEQNGPARIGTDLLFEFNSSELKRSARPVMIQLAALISQKPTTNFIISGYTDSLGSDSYNIELSRRRALAVLRWLQSNNVPTDHVYLRACGASNFQVSPSLPREQQAKNRRIEVETRRHDELLPDGASPASSFL